MCELSNIKCSYCHIGTLVIYDDLYQEASDDKKEAIIIAECQNSDCGEMNYFKFW